MRTYENTRGAADVRFKTVGVGHAMRVKADCCGKYLGSIAGCTRYHGTMLRCPSCTAEYNARKAGRYDAHVKTWLALAPLRSNVSTEAHDAHVHARSAWVLAVVAERSEVVDGHLLWRGAVLGGTPMIIAWGTRFPVRRLYFGLTRAAASNNKTIAPSCGQERCLTCLSASHLQVRDGTIRTLDDLRSRCEVDKACGCWRWVGKFRNGNDPDVWFIEPDTGKGKSTTGRRAALHLKRGKPLPATHRAFQKRNCRHLDCVNPDHSTSGTRKDWGRYLTRSGRGNSTPENIAHLRARAEKNMRVTPAQALVVAKRLKAGEHRQDLAQEFNVSESLIRKIGKGQRKCDVALQAAPNASIFALAKSMAEAA